MRANWNVKNVRNASVRNANIRNVNVRNAIGSLREQALVRQGIHPEQMAEYQQADFRDRVLHDLQSIRADVRETRENTRETLVRLETLRDDVIRVGEQIKRELRNVYTKSRCKPLDVKTWHHCIKLYYELLFKLFTLSLNVLHVLCNSLRSFGHALICPFSIACVLVVWLGQILLMIFFSDVAIGGASFGQLRFIDVFKYTFHIAYVFSYTILSTCYNTFSGYYIGILTQMSEIVQQDINITAITEAIQNRGRNAIVQATDATQQRVREIVVEEVGSLLTETAEIPAMIYKVGVNATITSGAAIIGATVDATAGVSNLASKGMDKVGESLGQAYSDMKEYVPAARTALESAAKKIGSVYEYIPGQSQTGQIVNARDMRQSKDSIPETLIDIASDAKEAAIQAGEMAAQSAMQAGATAKQTAAKAAAAASEAAKSVWDGLPSTEKTMETSAAAAQALKEASQTAMKSAMKTWKSYMKGGTRNRKSRMSRLTKRNTVKRIKFTLLTPSEQKVFDQTQMGQSLIHMNMHKIQNINVNEQIYNMAVVLQMTETFIPFLIQSLNRSIEVCKLIHKHEIDVSVHNTALIKSLQSIRL